MREKQAHGCLGMKSLAPLVFVSKNSTEHLIHTAITTAMVGEKAYGLTCLPTCWTLPFIVVAADLFAAFSDTPDGEKPALLRAWSDRIVTALQLIGTSSSIPLIVRSSGTTEGMKERGSSYSCEVIGGDLAGTLGDCLRHLAQDPAISGARVPLIVQHQVLPACAKGHLSNERRCYEEKRDWLGEFESIGNETGKPFHVNLRNWRSRQVLSDVQAKPLCCNLRAHVSEVLRQVAVWAYGKGVRCHFEWVWDGACVYIVQADEEKDLDGPDPRRLTRRFPIVSKFSPECLIPFGECHAAKYSKLHNSWCYRQLGLATVPLYVLDDTDVIKGLSCGQTDERLRRDLTSMVKSSLVIRMDVVNGDLAQRQLLPRTPEVRAVDEALAWLIARSRDCQTTWKGCEPVFIFHNFVSAISSAFAYAVPGARKVQIEALWGLPEGLYYFSHDKFVVDTQVASDTLPADGDLRSFVVSPQLRFKQFFVAPDDNGCWTTQMVGRPHDWSNSIPNTEWVKEVARSSRRIADAEGKPVTIMWFIGVPKEVSKQQVCPWYHEVYDPGRPKPSRALRGKTPFDKTLVIRTTADVELLRSESEKGSSTLRRIRIQPREEALIRNKETLSQIGGLAKQIGAAILLEGGVLSHAYYQLLLTGAAVEVLHPFDGTEDKREFYKLVRDEIPARIERGGEVVKKTKLTGDFLLRALREKLIEEACEALDATDQEAILAELADVSEVIDAICKALGVPKKQLLLRQEDKRSKAGGFIEGVVLLETSNPTPAAAPVESGETLFPSDHNLAGNSASVDPHDVLALGHSTDIWRDRREHPAAIEIFRRVTVPFVRDPWVDNAQGDERQSVGGHTIQATIRGMRIGAKYQIELSLFFPREEQLRFHDF